ncbi:uvrD_C_2 domain-containing protein [Trichonephila clavipes]|nr:uvrD_C_2 domain-containing protein [Trichonephila clavipes]
MSYDYVTCKRCLECLFGLGALGKIKFQEQFRNVRAQVPPSGEKTGRVKITWSNWYSTLKRDTRDENGDIIRIWLKFPKSCGRKQATKLRNLSARLNLDDDAVPITSQTSSVALNNNKTIIAKRKHFPLVSALAMTIHKSQGGTYDAIVYEYDRKHPRELVYVALSRVTKIEGLFMVTKENTEDSWKFWIGRSGIPLNASESDKHLKRSTSHREDLTLELKKIENNTLQTVTQTFLEFISNKKGLSIFSFNCQSLHAHVTDLKNDAIVKNQMFYFCQKLV